MPRARIPFLSVLFALVLSIPAPLVAQGQKDHLSRLEADRVRDSETSSERIVLFVGFAADRMRKFQYELAKPKPDRRRIERMNDILDQFALCLDDAGELVQLGIEKSQDIREAAKELQTKGKEHLDVLEKLLAGEQDVSPYREHIEDAITSTKAALKDAEKALKEIAPGPVRRKP